MAKIVLYRLADWPVSAHLVPLLASLGIGGKSLDRVHYFYAEDVASPFSKLPETGGVPAHEDMLMAVSQALGLSARTLVTGADDEIVFGFHWSATEEELVAAAKKAKLEVVRFADVAARREAPSAAQKKKAEETERAIRESFLGSFPAAAQKAIRRYVESGGKMPKVPAIDDVPTYLFRRRLSELEPAQERLLDVWVAATERREALDWRVLEPDPEGVYADPAGTLRDLLLARGVTDTTIRHTLSDPATGRSAFGSSSWPSFHYLAMRYLADLDAVPESELPALFQAFLLAPPGVRDVAGIAVEAWVKRRGAANLAVETLQACSPFYGHRKGAFAKEMTALYAKRVLASGNATLDQLTTIEIYRDKRTGPEKKAFDRALEAAIGREDTTLQALRVATSQKIVDAGAIPDVVRGAFRRSLATGLRTSADYPDSDSVLVLGPVLAKHEPDMLLSVLEVASTHWDPRNLESFAVGAERTFPKKGYSKGALAHLAAHFSKPEHGTAKVGLGRILGRIGLS